MRERRLTIFDDKKPSIRAEKSDDGKMFFVGYAAVYNQRSKLILERGRIFYEILLPGCFDRVLQDPNLDVVLSVNHLDLYSLGRTVSGNLKLESDSVGLKIRASVPNTTLGRDTFEMVERGDYTDMSFQFSVDASGEDWIRDGDGNLLHIVREVSALYDCTICTLRGAYGETVIDVERASRMFTELQIQERGEPDPGENQDPGDPGDPPEGGGSNDNPDEEEKEEEIKVENELDQMIIDVHKHKSTS